jgi:hypothetical protein
VGRTSVRGDEADPGVDARGQRIGGGDHTQSRAAVGRNHVDPAEPDSDVRIEPLGEAELLEQPRCGVLIGNGDRNGRDPAESDCVLGHAE